MRALVIDGHFLGKSLIESLVEAKFETSVLSSPEAAPIAGVHAQLHADSHSAESLEQALKGGYWDVIYNLHSGQIDIAQQQIKAFAGKTNKMVLLSSCFVYPYGKNLNEEQFDASVYPIEEKLGAKGATEAQKLVEALFTQRADFKVMPARLPFLFSDHDPSRKVESLIKKIIYKEPVYLPNPQAKFSVLNLEDATKILLRLGLYPQDGAVNCAAESPLALSSLLKMIEEETYCQVRRIDDAKSEHLTAFSLKNDWYVDTSKLRSFEVHARNAGAWMPELVKKLCLRVGRDRA